MPESTATAVEAPPATTKPETPQNGAASTKQSSTPQRRVRPMAELVAENAKKAEAAKAAEGKSEAAAAPKPETAEKPAVAAETEKAEKRRTTLADLARPEGAATAPVDSTATTDVPEEQLREQKTDPESVKKRLRGVWAKHDALRAEHEKLAAEREALQRERDELLAKSGKIPDDVESQLKELRTLRRWRKLENDPEVEQKFTKRIADSERIITDTLKSAKLPDFWTKEIEQAGGLVAFARSTKAYTIPAKEEGGAAKRVTASEMYEDILDLLPPIDADTVRTAVADLSRTRTEKERFIAEEAAKADDTLKAEEGRASEASKAAHAREAAVADVAKKFAENAGQKLDWLKPLDVPASADAETRKRLAADNRHREQMREVLSGLIENPLIVRAAAMAETQEEMEEIGRMALFAVENAASKRELGTAQARIRTLEKELAEIRDASRTTTGSGGADSGEAVTGTPPPRRMGESDTAYMIRLRQAGFDNPAQIIHDQKNAR